MQLLATVQSVAVESFIRLLPPPEELSHSPSSEVTVNAWPLVQLNLPPLQTAFTVPPVAGFSAPNARVDVASMTLQTPFTLALTVITCVPPATTAPANAESAAAKANFVTVLFISLTSSVVRLFDGLHRPRNKGERAESQKKRTPNRARLERHRRICRMARAALRAHRVCLKATPVPYT